MIQSSHQFGLAASSPNFSESSLAGWVPVLRLRCAQPRTVRARYGALRAHPPNWIQTNLAPRGEAKPVGLIEGRVSKTAKSTKRVFYLRLGRAVYQLLHSTVPFPLHSHIGFNQMSDSTVLRNELAVILRKDHFSGLRSVTSAACRRWIQIGLVVWVFARERR